MTVEPVELTAAGVRLRPWRMADAPAVLAARTDPDVALWSPHGGGSDPESVRAALRAYMDWTDGGHACFAVEDDTGALVAGVRLYRIDAVARRAEIGYWAAPWSRGRGLTSRAVDTAAAWGLTHLGLAAVDLCHAVANPASCRVAEKAGFRFDALLPRSYRYGDGRWYDEHRHVRTGTRV